MLPVRLIVLHDDKRVFVLVEFVGDDPTDASETAHDIMPSEFGDFVLHVSPPDCTTKFTFQDYTSKHRRGKEYGSQPGHDQEDRELTSGRGQRVDLAVTHRRNSNDCHEKRIEEGPSFDEGETHGAGGDHAKV
jgi:hypothetical protein